jgi:phosphoenolpyruvate synthase/pyruvate phosphate dikinase
MSVKKIYKKKFEVLFRQKFNSNNSQENFNIEIMFNDVSDIVELEREKAVTNFRSIYLFK